MRTQRRAGLPGLGLHSQRRNIEGLGHGGRDAVAVTHAVEGLALDHLVHVLGLTVRRLHPCAGQLQRRQAGGGGEPTVGQYIDLQLHLLAHYHVVARHQLRLHPQLRFGRPQRACDQQQQPAEPVHGWAP
ncbi:MULTISPECIES: hypothetical protein [unclassified Pseudomonas]|uniref:hypothetical protein n=1 Tax=unclassified Pseudomonas TaxID=196821 RepID=UPI0014304A72|nr:MULTISPECIES: hypothetical protein [unclassified Pseudomonas]MDY0834124.1 hypothetical protein [Pseudomonas sp. SED1]NIL18428.1 hypothetical protein [Pseudomonas sp. AN3A02]